MRYLPQLHNRSRGKVRRVKRAKFVTGVVAKPSQAIEIIPGYFGSTPARDTKGGDS